jgi:hypothetical protein
MKLLIMQSSSFSHHFLCPPQHPILNTLGLCSSLGVRDETTGGGDDDNNDYDDDTS